MRGVRGEPLCCFIVSFTSELRVIELLRLNTVEITSNACRAALSKSQSRQIGKIVELAGINQFL